MRVISPQYELDQLGNSGVSIAVIMLHPGCNMVCSFCITEDALAAFSYGQAVALLDAFKKTSIRNVVFGGGEPFAWQYDLIRLTREAKQRGFLVQVGTNGVDLPEHFEAIPTIDRYVLPLESVDEDSHNAMRIYKQEHHAIILERLQQLKHAKKSVTVSTVVTQQNLSGLRDLGSFLKKYDASSGLLHAWHLYRFIPAGRGGRLNAPKLEVSLENYNHVTDELKQADLGFSIYKRRDMYDSESVEFFWYEQDHLQSTGKILPVL